MNADMKWLDNPEVFRVNQLEAHSDHTYYESYEALEKKENALIQSLNGQWEFVFSKNVKDNFVAFNLAYLGYALSVGRYVLLLFLPYDSALYNVRVLAVHKPVHKSARSH